MAFRSSPLRSLFHHLRCIMDILLTKVKPINEGIHRGSSFAMFALVRSLSIVSDKKRIQISLDFFKGSINILSKEHRIELIKKRLIESFGDTVCLRMSGLGLRMLNIIEIQK